MDRLTGQRAAVSREVQRQARDMARRFAERELAPTTAERDRTRRFPRKAVFQGVA
jgi:hypothetical protein